MSKWVDLNGPIVADSVYVGGVLAARDAAVTLPAITPITADYKAMGTMSLPVNGQFESMEATITKVGIDLGLAKLVRFKNNDYEFRWVQDSVTADGIVSTVGCKAFVRGIPKVIPGLSLEPGSISENEITIEVSRFQLIANGVELWLIDRLSQVLRIEGVDYFKDFNGLL